MKLSDIKKAVRQLSKAEQVKLGQFLIAEIAKPVTAKKPITQPSLAEKIARIKMTCGVNGLKVVASKAAVEAQTTDNISFEIALQAAITNLLTDDRDIESPMGMLQNDPEVFGLPYEGLTNAKITEQLKVIFNDGQTTLTLVTPTFQFQAENGEKIAGNWIFLLQAPKAWDSLMWVIVDKTGQKAAYNYGFS